MTQKSSRKTRAATRRPSGGEARLTRTPDSGVVLSVLLLASIGTVMSYSATATLALDHSLPPLFLAHIGALGIGLVLTTVITWTPIDRWRQAALPLWVLSLVLLVLVEFLGVRVNGAQRWLELPGLGFRFQPVELCKLTTLLLVAAVIARRDGHDELSGTRSLVAAGLTLPPIGLLLVQPDLGNAVLLACLVSAGETSAADPPRRLTAFPLCPIPSLYFPNFY